MVLPGFSMKYAMGNTGNDQRRKRWSYSKIQISSSYLTRSSCLSNLISFHFPLCSLSPSHTDHLSVAWHANLIATSGPLHKLSLLPRTLRYSSNTLLILKSQQPGHLLREACPDHPASCGHLQCFFTDTPRLLFSVT